MQFFVVWIIIGAVISCVVGEESPSLLNSLRKRFVVTQSEKLPHAHSTEKGYVTCACGKLLPDLLRTLYFLRIEWKSRTPVSIMHCNELTNEDASLLSAMDEFGNIRVVDICQAETMRTHGLDQMNPKNLRGFLCKVAAMIVSPYENTLLIDLDLVWFRSPDLLFESKLYQQTGTLFFRDRVMHVPPATSSSGAPNERMEQLVAVFTNHQVNLNKSYVQEQYFANGISPWWRCLQPYWDDAVENCYSEAQDSSMVLVNKRKHPGMIAMLQQLIVNFNVGYGDKEIFWIAATLANEPFLFSPFAAGQYGDCSGQILHYFPDDIHRIKHFPKNSSYSSDTAIKIEEELHRIAPFYMNAEYVVENGKKLNAVGNYFQRRYVSAHLFHDPRTMSNIQTNALPHNFCYSLPHFGSNCSCSKHHCQPLPDWIYHQIAYHQYVSLSLSMDRRLTPSAFYVQTKERVPYCIPVLVSALSTLNSVFSNQLAGPMYSKYLADHRIINSTHHSHSHFSKGTNSSLSKLPRTQSHRRSLTTHTMHSHKIHSPTIISGFDRRNCALIGCPFFPFMIFNESFIHEDAWSPGFGRFCDPVSFEIPANDDPWNQLTADGASNIRSQHLYGSLSSYGNQSLATLAQQFRVPRAPFNTPPFKHDKQLILCNGKRSIFQLGATDKVFHSFPNWATFVKMGLDTSDVMNLQTWECDMLIFGETLPEV